MKKIDSAKVKTQRKFMFASTIRGVLSKALSSGKILPEITELLLIDVIHVNVSPTLEHVDVFISVMHDEEEVRNSVLSKLNDSRHIINNLIAKNMKMRYIPNIRFVLTDIVNEISQFSELDSVLYKK